MKSISTIKFIHYRKYKMLDHRSTHLFIDLKVNVSLGHGVPLTMLCFANTLGNILSKK